MKKTDYVSKGHSVVTPVLFFDDLVTAIKWYKRVFRAKRRMKFANADNVTIHAEIQIGDSLIMMSKAGHEYNETPHQPNGNSITLCLYVRDVDSAIENAVDHDAKLVSPARDMFYGDRAGRIQDPFGYTWIISTHMKDVSKKEMREALADQNNHA